MKVSLAFKLQMREQFQPSKTCQDKLQACSRSVDGDAMQNIEFFINNAKSSNPPIPR